MKLNFFHNSREAEEIVFIQTFGEHWKTSKFNVSFFFSILIDTLFFKFFHFYSMRCKKETEE